MHPSHLRTDGFRSLKPTLSIFTLAILLANSNATSQEPQRWRQHERTRPRPAVVTPANPIPSVSAPSDAMVLFDGKDLRNWQGADGTETRWKVEDGCMLPTPDSGPIVTKETFGDVQLHVEWKAPLPPSGNGQGRGNSGIYIMGKYEVQILDSYQNETYADGQAAAIYGQFPPLANASLPPGEWQSYDIIFRRPRFNPDGTLRIPTTITVLHNGILVQDHSQLWGSTNWLSYYPYENHPDSLPLALQDHGNPVRYRNIWIRRLDEPRMLAAPPKEVSGGVTMSPNELDAYVGIYRLESDADLIIRRDGEHLVAEYYDKRFLLRPMGNGLFEAVATDVSFRFGTPPNTVEFDQTGHLIKGRRL